MAVYGAKPYMSAFARYTNRISTKPPVTTTKMAAVAPSTVVMCRQPRPMIVLFEPMSRLDLSESLIGHRIELAAQLAALEFERAVRAYAKKSASADELSDVITRFAPAHAVGEWQRGRTLRNRAVHGRPLNEHEVRSLILTARQIDDLETLKRGLR